MPHLKFPSENKEFDVVLEIEDGVGCVEVWVGKERTWGQCGTIRWALGCAIDAMQSEKPWKRPFDASGRPR